MAGEMEALREAAAQTVTGWALLPRLKRYHYFEAGKRFSICRQQCDVRAERGERPAEEALCCYECLSALRGVKRGKKG